MSKPIVLGVDGETREMIERAGTGLPIPPQDQDALVRAVQTLKHESRFTLPQPGAAYLRTPSPRPAQAGEALFAGIEERGGRPEVEYNLLPLHWGCKMKIINAVRARPNFMKVPPLHPGTKGGNPPVRDSEAIRTGRWFQFFP